MCALNWKQKIDTRLEVERRAEIASYEKAAREKRAEEAKELAEHQVLFKCHIRGCLEVSKGPWEKMTDESFSKESTAYITCPTGLEECARCGQWTCPKHLYQGICMECAEKM